MLGRGQGAVGAGADAFVVTARPGMVGAGRLGAGYSVYAGGGSLFLGARFSISDLIDLFQKANDDLRGLLVAGATFLACTCDASFPEGPFFESLCLSEVNMLALLVLLLSL